MSYIPQLRAIGTKRWYGECRFATREQAQAWFTDRTDVETQIIESPYKPTHEWINGMIHGRGGTGGGSRIPKSNFSTADRQRR